MNDIIADALNVTQPNLHRRQRQIVQGAVLKAFSAGMQEVAVALYRRHRDRAAGEPGTVQFCQGAAAGDQRANAGRVAENFIEGKRDKIRVDGGEIQRIGGGEGGRIQQHIPSFGLRQAQSSTGHAGRRRNWTGPDRQTGCWPAG